jgi:ubiquinone/menaquinone biosynthesis C-methylase UbiE
MKVNIPKKENIFVTSYEDPAVFYYKPFVRRFYLRRLEMAIDLLDDKKKVNVLEIGYGCGVFLPELSKRFSNVYAIDSHLNAKGVSEMLTKEGVSSHLLTADVFNLPFKNDVFDCIIVLSVLEHLNNLIQAIREIKRTANENAQIIFGIPAENWFMKTSFRLLGYKIDDLHVSSHDRIKKAIEMELKVEKLKRFPNLFNCGFFLYTVASCRKGKGL